MRRKIIGCAVAVAALGSLAGVALAGGGAASGCSRLDDGGDLMPKVAITEREACSAAQAAAPGALNEVDLETYAGRLVFNVDVGDRDVKVDAATGGVLGVARDDDKPGSDD